jgi:predicted nuclease of restriction endonuclease-like RecB superfamily
MLPSNLFSGKVRKGKVVPNYIPLEAASISLAKNIIGIFQESVGKKRGYLLARLEELESSESTDYKTLRGLAAILNRRCTFIVDSKVEPVSARTTVFEEASKRRIATTQQKQQLLVELSARMNLLPGELEESMFKDLEEEQVLTAFDPVSPLLLVQAYNLSLAQTALFKSVSMEFVASGNWKRIFRDIKRFGLMYSVEKREENDRYAVFLDGPLSLFKMTERYGTSLAKLLPTIVAGDSWSFNAEIIDRRKNNRILRFEENKGSAPEFAGLFDREEESLFDSSVEERFASKFNSLSTGWELRREPEPLIAGSYVLIPDFSLEKYGFKIFMEIVGFWTKEYIERKLSKLASLTPDTRIIVALNESLHCSEAKLAEVKSKAVMLLTYSREVPVDAITSYLKTIEQAAEEKLVEELRTNKNDFTGKVVSLEQVARDRNVPLQIVKRALTGSDLKGYKMIGDFLLSESKIETIGKKMKEEFASGDSVPLGVASRVIESLGVAVSPAEILSSLGYEIDWSGLDLDASKVKRKAFRGLS